MTARHVRLIRASDSKDKSKEKRVSPRIHQDSRPLSRFIKLKPKSDIITAMSKFISAASAMLSVALVFSHVCDGAEPFLEKPYLQLGDSPRLSTSENMVLIWHTDDKPAEWTVEVRTSKDSTLRAA